MTNAYAAANIALALKGIVPRVVNSHAYISGALQLTDNLFSKLLQNNLYGWKAVVKLLATTVK